MKVMFAFVERYVALTASDKDLIRRFFRPFCGSDGHPMSFGYAFKLRQGRARFAGTGTQCHSVKPTTVILSAAKNLHEARSFVAGSSG